MSNYDKYPEIRVTGYDNSAYFGYDEIVNRLKADVNGRDKAVIVVDFYPGVREGEVLEGLSGLEPDLIINSDECAMNGKTMDEFFKEYLTDDRVFGVMTTRKLDSCFYPEKLEEARKRIENLEKGLVLVYGVGAGLITLGDIYVYADLARWEIQSRFRAGMPNWRNNNYDEDVLTKYKRGFFVEWRIADRHKKKLYEKMDYVLDTNSKDEPKMVTGEAFREALKQAARRPFRLVPFFDPGVWGGQWMKEVCGLDPSEKNYAWCFDGVPEENSLYFRFGHVRIEVPAINVVFYQPRELLGDKIHGRFGAEFPIRFNFLDTMGGQNLSLQVHPITEYIQETFGMHYTQSESYYILDAKEDGSVFLGIKEDVDPAEMMRDLRRAQDGEISFPDHKYINRFPAKKHDHFPIPGGTIHCSGKNTMVLEISTTINLFTFKLWDWDRVGLDGKPRPIHIDHGEQVIQWNRRTEWIKQNLLPKATLIEEGDGYREEKTGLHERQFLETRRHWFTKPVLHNTDGKVNVLNLVEGEEAIVESPTGAFAPFVVHYAETFIIPASVKEYTIRPYGKSEGKEIATIKAYIRG